MQKGQCIRRVAWASRMTQLVQIHWACCSEYLNLVWHQSPDKLHVGQVDDILLNMHIYWVPIMYQAWAAFRDGCRG